MKKNIKLFAVLTVAVLLSVIGCIKVQAADRTLKNGKWMNGTLTQEKTINYYKVSVKKTGYIKIDYVRENEDSFTNFSICNKKKKEIWKNNMVLSCSYTGYFPVKKGTYYICIDDVATAWDFGEEDDTYVYNAKTTESYQIKYTFTAMKEGKKIKRLADAPLLKRKCQVSGLMFTGKKTHDMCYKYTVSQKTKVKFTYEAFGPWLRIANSKGKYLNFNSKGQIHKSGDSVTWWEGKGSDSVTLPAGTYYFVIQDFEAGYYKLKLK